MRFRNREVEESFFRCQQDIVDIDLYHSPRFVSLKEALTAHYLVADHFYTLGYGMASIGPKSVDLLISALSRQFTAFGGVEKWSTDLDRCASLLFGMVMNHPFHDANKRTAFLCLLLGLRKVGRVPKINKNAFEDFLVRVADHKLTDLPVYSDIRLRHDEEDGEVKCISHFLQRNTRRRDNSRCALTYRQLDTILGRYGYKMSNPDGNRIDIVRPISSSGIAFWRRDKVVTQIGFPAWTKQVPEGTLARLRKDLNLTEDDGYDSAAFLGEEDSLGDLIQEYHDQLVSLADR